jgi:hypothetical protein
LPPANPGDTPWRLYTPDFIDKKLAMLRATPEERVAVWLAVIGLCESPSGTEDVQVVVAQSPALEAIDGGWLADDDLYIAHLPYGFLLTFELWPRGRPPLAGRLLAPRALVRTRPAVS